MIQWVVGNGFKRISFAMEEALSFQREFSVKPVKVSNCNGDMYLPRNVSCVQAVKNNWSRQLEQVPSIIKKILMQFFTPYMMKTSAFCQYNQFQILWKVCAFAWEGRPELDESTIIWLSYYHLWEYGWRLNEKHSVSFIHLHSTITCSIGTCSSFRIKSVLARSTRRLSQRIVKTNWFYRS